jgi:integrase
MARFFRPSYTRPLPASAKIIQKNGQRFVRLELESRKSAGRRRIVLAKLTRAGDRCVVKSETWWASYQDVDGLPRRVELSTSKSDAKKAFGEIEERLRRWREGTLPKSELFKTTPFEEHVAAYRKELENNNRTAKHVDKTIGYIERTAAGCGFVTLANVDAEKVTAFLAGLRATRRKGRRGTLSISGSNGYVTALRAFGKWLADHDRTERSPFLSLKKLNAETDPRHQRRALSLEEVSTLLCAAGADGRFRGLPWFDRRMLYATAVYTGLRVSELASLTPRSFKLDGDPPTVHVGAAYSKHRRNDVLPLHPALVAELRGWLTERHTGTGALALGAVAMWPGTWTEKASVMIARDLRAARQAWIGRATAAEEALSRKESDFLRYRDHRGLVADFHCLRHTFITTLARSGLHPTQAKELARHSSITLTIDRYSHVKSEELHAAIEAVPNFTPPMVEPLAKTGTDDADAKPERSLACRDQPKVDWESSRSERLGAVEIGNCENGEENRDSSGLRMAADDSEKPPGGLEPSTYALRMRRSTN